MPAYAYARLQKTISQIILGLRNGWLAKWFKIPSQIVPKLLSELEGWRAGIEHAYSTGECRRIVIECQVRARYHRQMALMSHFGRDSDGDRPAPRGCEFDRMVFDFTGALLLPEDIMDETEPDFAQIVWRSGNPKSSLPYLDEHWRPNPTFVDLTWQVVRNTLGKDPDFGSDPFENASLLFEESEIKKPRKPSSLFDYCSAFFRPVADALGALQDRITVEIFLGEMSDIMERLRYGTLAERNGLEENLLPDAPRLPTKYHRIHMSNIPDYTGGLLCSFLYASPLMDRTTRSNFSSVVLRNPPAFKSSDDFFSEYCVASDTTFVYQLFGDLMYPGSQLFTSPHPLPMAEYLAWEPMPPGRTLKGCGMEDLDEGKFEKFLFANFLKLILPFPRDTRGNTLIYSPLNFATFLNLIDRLHGNDLPSHRMSDVLTAILSNAVETTARAPRSSPLDKDECNQTFSRRRMCIQPFLAECTTQVALWREVASFGFNHDSLPKLSQIAEYEVKLGALMEGVDFNVPHSGLLFWNSKIAKLPTSSLRALLLDDEVADRSEAASDVRKHGARVVSVFNWNSRTETVKFWMRKDIVQDMQDEGGWSLYFLRTDLWKTAMKAVDVADIQSMRIWTDP